MRLIDEVIVVLFARLIVLLQNTLLYLSALKPAKWARITRSSFSVYLTSLGLSGGCEQAHTVKLANSCCSTSSPSVSVLFLTHAILNFDLNAFF